MWLAVALVAPLALVVLIGLWVRALMLVGGGTASPYESGDETMGEMTDELRVEFRAWRGPMVRPR